MKRFLCFFFAAILLFLTACGQPHGNTESQKTTVDSFASGSFPKVELWKPYKGSIPEANLQDLEVLATQEDTGDLFFLGSYYEALAIPDDKYQLAHTCGWRIDLDSLSIAGKTESDEIILVQDISSPTLVCTVDASKQVTVYFRKDFAQGGLNAIDFSEFDIFHEGNIIEDRQIVERIWQNHTQKPTDLLGNLLLDGDFTDYRLTLIHGEESAMQYELNFGICAGNLYIKNPYVRLDHEVPLSHLTFDEIQLGDSIYEVRKQAEDIVLDYFSLLAFRRTLRSTVAIANGGQISAIAEFSPDGTLLSSEGLVAVELTGLDKLVGLTMDEIVATYGEIHTDLGSGRFIPAYVTNRGTVVAFALENDTVISICENDILTGAETRYGEVVNIHVTDELP